MSLFLRNRPLPRGNPAKAEVRAMEKSFKVRKDCIKRKLMELCVLCDVKGCAIIVGPDGKLESWPENLDEVQEVIGMYKRCLDRKRKRPQELDLGGVDQSKKKQKISVEMEFKSNQELIRKIDAKLTEVRKRIQFLKAKNQDEEGSSQCFDTISNEVSFFPGSSSCDYTAEIPVCFDTQLVEMGGFQGTEELQWWLASFSNMESDQTQNSLCSGVHGGQEVLEIIPNSYKSSFEVELFQQPEQTENSVSFDNLVVTNEEERNEFQETNPNSFNSGSEFLETFKLHEDHQEFQPSDTFDPNSFHFDNVIIDSNYLWWDDAAASLLY